MSHYSIDRELACPFPEAVERVKTAFREHGFGTLSEIDVQATLREKLGKELGGYTILGVCNPGLAAQAIDAEANMGVFLPCTVLVREENGVVQVAAQEPAPIEEFIGNPALGPMALEARSRIVAALDALG